MSRGLTRWGVLIVLAIVIAPAAPARAQSTIASPKTLFGRERARPERHRRADVVASIFEAYNGGADADWSAGPAAGTYVGPHTGLTLAFMFVQPLHAFTLDVRGESTAAWYPSLNGFVAGLAHGDVAVGGPLGRRVRLRLSQSAAYTPFYDVSVPDPGDAAPIAAQVFMREAHYVQVSGAADVKLDRRSSVTFETALQQFDARQSAPQTTIAPAGRFQHQLTNNASVRIGYGQRVANSELGRAIAHDFDAGVDYQRALSFSKRTTFNVGSGSAVAVTADGRRPFLTGRAQLRREIGRTWTAAVSYGRQVHFLDGFADPYLADAAGVSLDGALGRRVDVQTRATYSLGAIGSGPHSGNLRTTAGSVGLRIALNRRAALYTEYRYRQSKLSSHLITPAYGDWDLNRQRMGIGLTLWTPLVR